MQPGHRDPLEKSASKVGQVNKNQRRSYDANFKLMVVNEAERTNNVRAGKKYDVTECNVRRWRSQKDELKNAHSQRRSYRGPQTGRFTEVDRRVCEYVNEKRNEGMPITRAVIQQKALEVATELNIPRAEFKASMSWCRRMMRRNGLSLRRRTSLAQHLPADFREKLVNYQRFVIKLRKKHEYPLDQMGNADQTPVFFLHAHICHGSQKRRQVCDCKVHREREEPGYRYVNVPRRWDETPPLCDFKTEDSTQRSYAAWHNCACTREGVDGVQACGGLAEGCVGQTSRGT